MCIRDSRKVAPKVHTEHHRARRDHRLGLGAERRARRHQNASLLLVVKRHDLNCVSVGRRRKPGRARGDYSCALCPAADLEGKLPPGCLRNAREHGGGVGAAAGALDETCLLYTSRCV